MLGAATTCGPGWQCSGVPVCRGVVPAARRPDGLTGVGAGGVQGQRARVVSVLLRVGYAACHPCHVVQHSAVASGSRRFRSSGDSLLPRLVRKRLRLPLFSSSFIRVCITRQGETPMIVAVRPLIDPGLRRPTYAASVVALLSRLWHSRTRHVSRTTGGAQSSTAASRSILPARRSGGSAVGAGGVKSGSPRSSIQCCLSCSPEVGTTYAGRPSAQARRSQAWRSVGPGSSPGWSLRHTAS